MRLGKMERVQTLRQIWPHEAYDFTKWLAKEENLLFLGDTIGVNLELIECESSVGTFHVDIFAQEVETGRKVIIENQLEDTDHDHLGKIMTYAAGKNAEIIIWIVKRARDEHRQAIEWLNQHTDENIGFFLLELELWRIGNSLPAPKLNVVERPNDWAKTVKIQGELSLIQKLQLSYWESFSSYAFENELYKSVFSRRKAHPQHWYDLGTGVASVVVKASVNTQKNKIGAELYIANNKPLFERYKENAELIENELNLSLEWREAAKDCRIYLSRDGSIKENKLNWNEQFDWLCEMTLKLREIAVKYA